MTRPVIAVVGGGIAGLAAAWEMRSTAEVVIWEPADLGGKIKTTPFAGIPVDEGPDAFLTRVPGAVQLCAELGLSDELVAPNAGRTLVWSAGRLHELPAGLVLGVPTSIRTLVGSGLLTPFGLLRAGLDLVLPATPPGEDESVGRLIARRFGPEVAYRLVEPLVGSIHAAPIDEVSAAATVPDLLAAARRSRSLLKALRRRPAAQSAGSPIFLTHPEGLTRMVEELVARLVASGVSVEKRAASSVTARPAGVEIDGERFDGAVLAVPAKAAAGLLGSAAPTGLSAIEATDVALVTLDVDASALGVGPDVNGVLVRPGTDMLMAACSFGSSKWPQWQPGPGRAVVRISAGRHGDRRIAEMTDADLAARLTADLARALGADLKPATSRVSRWPGAFPLYRVGHLELVDRIEEDLEAAAPGVALAGSSYRGSGIPACIASGRRAAQKLAGVMRVDQPTA